MAFENIGPYHAARLAALAGRVRTEALQFQAASSTYRWCAPDLAAGVPCHTLRGDPDPRGVAEQIDRILDEVRPSVVAVPGWYDWRALILLRSARRKGVPLILMSDSQRIDAARSFWREYPKRILLRQFAAALVGGRRHLDYLHELGMPREAVRPGYDVVDNAHFRRAAGGCTRRGVGRRLLACNRLVEKKNLARLIAAVARHNGQAPAAERFTLTIVGDGPLRGELEAEARALAPGQVVFEGHVDHADLPACYASADAFILASTVEQWGLVVNEAMAAGLPVLVSTACGCAPELVVDGENGFVFDPSSAESIAEAIGRLPTAPAELSAMGRASEHIIADWTPERFADEFARAMALAAGDRRRWSLFDEAVTGVLARSLRP